MPTLPENGLLTPVVCFKPRDTAHLVQTVYQEDCDELEALRVEFRKIKDKMEEKERWIREALRCGARMEPGIYKPEITEFQQAAYCVPAKKIVKLVMMVLCLLFPVCVAPLFAVDDATPWLAEDDPVPVSSDDDRARKQLHFAGNASLTIGRDSMTDKRVCFAETPMTDGASLSFFRPAIFVNLATDVQADYSEAAYLRIGIEKPVRLSIPRRPHVLYVPLARSAAILRALYTQTPIRLQFTEWPSGRIYDQALQLGDFAAAYDRGIKLCGWPKLNLRAVHPDPVSPNGRKSFEPPSSYSSASGELFVNLTYRGLPERPDEWQIHAGDKIAQTSFSPGAKSENLGRAVGRLAKVKMSFANRAL